MQKLSAYQKYNSILRCVALLFMFLSVIKMAFAQTDFQPFYISGYAQGTTYHITYYAKDSVVLQQDVDQLLNKVDSSLSVYKTYSLISKFNNPQCHDVVMDKYLSTVVNKSLDIYKQSGGLFDITVYPLVCAWGFGNRHIENLPDSAAIQSILPCIGSDKLLVKGNKLIKKTPCVQIDVDGIAQGYSVDVLADYMDSKNIKNYLIEVGGELRVKGHKQPENIAMKIGIEQPAKNSNDEPVIQTIIQMDKGGLTTSGNYRKYFKSRNQVMSHLIDPKSGYPLQNDLIAVTVWAKDAITADGYDNPLMTMGLKKALQFMKQHPDMEAYFIFRKNDGSVTDTATAGFYKLIQKTTNYK